MNPLEDVLGIHPGRSHQLRDAMLAIAAEGRGVVVLLRDMGAKLDIGDHVSPHRLRQYGIGAQILNALGLHELILLTNSPNPRPVGLDGYGLSIAGTRPIRGRRRPERWRPTTRAEPCPARASTRRSGC